MSADQKRFSHSLVDTYLDCPRKAYFRYVENIKAPPGVALIKGRGCDEAWNDALKLRIASDGAETMATDDIISLTEERFRQAIRDEGGPSSIRWDEPGDPKEHAREGLASAIKLSRVWATELYPSIQPSAVQVELHRELPSGRDFIGFIDWQGHWDNLPCLGDNKTGSSKMSQNDADKNLQPYAYAWLREDFAEADETNFVFARAIETRAGNTNSEFVLTTRSKADLAWYDTLVQQVEEGFVAEVFPPNPKSNLCSPKWCPFYERCQPHRSVHAGADSE